MSAALRYSVQPDGALAVEARCELGWQSITDGATGKPIDLSGEMQAAGSSEAAQEIWDRLFKAGRTLSSLTIPGVDQ